MFSVPDPVPDPPVPFFSGFRDDEQKISFFCKNKFFVAFYLLTVSKFTTVFKDYKSLRSHNTYLLPTA